MIIKRQNMSENKWNHFKIVPQGHHNCQLSIVNCQFGEVAKFQFGAPKNDTERRRAETTTHILRTTWPPALRANSYFPVFRGKPIWAKEILRFIRKWYGIFVIFSEFLLDKWMQRW